MSRLERQARFWLRAYPRGWREERGAEVLGTILDLAGDARQRLSPRLAADLAVGGWSERARRHVRSVGPLAAGWRLATSIAVIAQLVVAVVWLRDWLVTGTPAILAHVIGNASEVTYLGALIAFVVAASAWLGGWQRTARRLGGIAMTSWVLTVVVFHALSNPMMTDWLEVLVWTYLATAATIGLFQRPPTHPRVVATAALVAVLAAQTSTTGVAPLTSVGQLFFYEHQFPIALFDRGADTLHTALRTGWMAMALAGLALVRIDPRPVVAACWLLPFLALDHLYWGGVVGLTTGVIAATAVMAFAVRSKRLQRS